MLDGHWNPDGSCSCPFDGVCWECGKFCNDHDLCADYWWCAECTNRSFDELEEQTKNTKRLDIF